MISKSDLTWHEKVVISSDAAVRSYDISICEKSVLTNIGIELHCMVHILPSLTTAEAWSLFDRVQNNLALDGSRMLLKSGIEKT